MGLEPTTLPGVTWTDDPIVAGVTDVKAAHLTELRDAVNAARVAHGLSAATWTDATVMAGVTVIQAVHIAELRAAINAVYTAAGVTPPTYTDPTLTVGVTAVKAVHLTELRAARANAPAAEVTATRYYHLDALGSVRAVTDAAGATVRRHDYTAFGEAPTPAVGADARRFTGKERDAETGLDYFSARYYGSASGRFTTVDPLMGTEVALEDPQRWNRYSYVGNRPTRIIDPDGRGWLSKLVKVAVKGGDVAATFADVAVDLHPVLDRAASEGERLLAGLSVASELAPVSLGDVRMVSAAIKGGAGPVRAGQAGELAAGLSGPKTPISINGRTRIPDAITESSVIEVKNVKYQSRTRQITDLVDYARENGLALILRIRRDTKVSKPLRAAEKRGEVQIEYIGGGS